MFYVYVLKSKKSDVVYIGYTNNLKRRYDEHNHSPKPDSFTYKHRPWLLAYYEAYASEQDARLREARLQQHGSARHLLLTRINRSCYSLE